MCICKWRINKARRKAIIWLCFPQHSTDFNCSEKCRHNSNSNCNNATTIIETLAPILWVVSMRKRFSGILLWPRLGSVPLTACPGAKEPDTKFRLQVYRSQRYPSRFCSILDIWKPPALAFYPLCPSCSPALDRAVWLLVIWMRDQIAYHLLSIIKVSEGILKNSLKISNRSFSICRYWFLWQVEQLDRILGPRLPFPMGFHIFLITYSRMLGYRFSINTTSKAETGSSHGSSAIQKPGPGQGNRAEGQNTYQ